MNKKRVLYEAEEYRDIRELVKSTVSRYPDNIAFVIKEKQKDKVEYKNITYKMLQEDINKLGTGLIDLGLEGKRIAIIANNRYEWCIAYLATLCGVGIVVPLDKSLPAGEIENLLKRSYANAVVFEDKYSEVMRHIKENGDNDIECYICMDKKDDGEFLSLQNILKKGKELLEKGDTLFENTVINPEVMNIILFTSGTTGKSKAVMLSQKNIVSNIYALNSIIKVYPTDRNMAFLPFHHTFGSTGLLFFISNGVSNVFCDGLKYIAKNLRRVSCYCFCLCTIIIRGNEQKSFKRNRKTR